MIVKTSKDGSKERWLTWLTCERTRVTGQPAFWRAPKNEINPSSVSLLRHRIHLKEIVDKDEICGKGDRHRGCGSTQDAESWTVAHEPLAYQLQANKHNKRTRRTLAIGSYHVSHHGRLFWWIDGERRLNDPCRGVGIGCGRWLAQNPCVTLVGSSELFDFGGAKR